MHSNDKRDVNKCKGIKTNMAELCENRETKGRNNKTADSRKKDFDLPKENTAEKVETVRQMHQEKRQPHQQKRQVCVCVDSTESAVGRKDDSQSKTNGED